MMAAGHTAETLPQRSVAGSPPEHSSEIDPANPGEGDTP